MKVSFLESTISDLAWFGDYYSVVFPSGGRLAYQQMANMCQLLEANPFMGHSGQISGTRELHIPRTPFTLIYQVAEEEIEILRVWDERRGGFN